ncbi:MAG TPA: GH25 family lysozyme [Thermoanaerobaculia bacterium]|nr:GH25 family lysozyme [Thermoanaerobaculia bacterium]
MSETPAPGATPQLHGIDVSHYQGAVDWPAVAAGGMAFAFVKATQGTSSVDPLFSQNWNGVQAAGLLRGAYHFFQPGEDPAAQAAHFLSVVPCTAGDLPPVLDVETAGSLTPAEIVQGIETWLAAVEAAAGCAPIVYTAPRFWDSLGTAAFGRFPLWVAEYGVSTPKLPAGWTSWSFWQSSESGQAAGVHGNVDLDVFQGSLEDLHLLTAR